MEMQEIKISLDKLNAIDLSPLLQKGKAVTCFDITNFLSGLGYDSAEVKLLIYICNFHFRPSNPYVPFSSGFQSSQGRSLIPNDIDDSSLQVLSQFCPTIKLPELQARIADTLWIRKIDGIRFPLLAVRAYQQSCKDNMASQVVWVDVIERLERALRICCFFRKNHDFNIEFEQLSELLTAEYERTKTETDSPYPMRLLQLALECRVREHDFLVAEFMYLSRQYLANKKFTFAIDTCKSAIPIAQDRQLDFWRLLADTYIQDSKFQDGRLISAASIQNAIEALRYIPDTKKERDALYEDMRDYQLESRHQMETLKSPPQDISQIIDEANSRVIGSDLFDMVFRLAILVSRPVDIDRLKDQALKRQTQSISWIFGSTHVDHEGMNVAHIPAGLGVDHANESHIWAEMIQEMRINHQLAVSGQIIPAMDKITMKYQVSEEFFRALCINHPFIPFGHEEFFIKGMVYGFNRDFMTACHVLIPQIENSLRYMAKIKGQEPSLLHGDGSQERNGLKALLDNPLIIEALGKNIVINLNALLLDKIYGDLRNQLSHGYMPADYYNQSPSVYTWWLVLHILMIPMCGHWNITYNQKN